MEMTPEESAAARKLLVDALAGFSFDSDAFFLALGRFVSAFADTEANLQTVLWHFAGVESPTAPAVFSGVKTDAAMSLLKRIAEAQKWPAEPKAELDYISGQLGQINQLRNDILHFGARHTGPDTWLVSNKLFAHTAERLRETHVTPTTLNEAASDLHKIDSHLTVMA